MLAPLPLERVGSLPVVVMLRTGRPARQVPLGKTAEHARVPSVRSAVVDGSGLRQPLRDRSSDERRDEPTMGGTATGQIVSRSQPVLSNPGEVGRHVDAERLQEARRLGLLDDAGNLAVRGDHPLRQQDEGSSDAPTVALGQRADH